MSVYLIVPIATFILIFIRAFQQRNVAHAHYVAMLPTSMAFAFAEYFVILSVVKQGFDMGLILLIGVSAGLSSMLATYLHKRIFSVTTHGPTGT